MLLPFPTELLRRFYAPVTWTLILLNYMTFIWTNHVGVPIEKTLNKIVADDLYMHTQGVVYARYVKENTHRYSNYVNQFADLALKGHRVSVMSHLAINDPDFVREGVTYDYAGDQVAIDKWRLQFSRFLDLRERGPLSAMGLSTSQSGLMHLISYQFSHSGFFHFASNMVFLLLFGSLLEPLIGGASLIVVYLMSGLFAALFFLLSLTNSIVPLIGASGSVSGLMALYSAIYWSRSVRFFYFLFVPRVEYLGYVYLPGWVLLFLWMTPDLAGFLSSMEGLNGVAYVAHLGGELTGLSVGFCFWFIRKLSGNPLPNCGIQEPPVGTHWSFADLHLRWMSMKVNESPPREFKGFLR